MQGFAAFIVSAKLKNGFINQLPKTLYCPVCKIFAMPWLILTYYCKEINLFICADRLYLQTF